MEIIMDTKEYLELIAKHGDSHSDKWDMLAVSPDQTLFLVKDRNRICYVSTSDMINFMPYNIALGEGRLAHYASDSVVEEVQAGVEHGSIKPTTLVAINLTAEDLKWLKSNDISTMVHSVEA
jgi:hypothetical protein